MRTGEDITVTTPDGRALPAVLAGRDPGTDLAVLTVKDAGSATAALGDDAALKASAISCWRSALARASSWGVVAAVGPRWRSWRGGEIERLVRLDLTLYPGFSGGPLVDASGSVVGLNTSGLARDARLAVPATTVTRVDRPSPAAPGTFRAATSDSACSPCGCPRHCAGRLGLTRETGLIVVTVEPDGPAARAGVLLGDVLVALDGAPVGDLEDVQACLGSDRIGAAVPALLDPGGRPDRAVHHRGRASAPPLLSPPAA